MGAHSERPEGQSTRGLQTDSRTDRALWAPGCPHLHTHTPVMPAFNALYKSHTFTRTGYLNRHPSTHRSLVSILGSCRSLPSSHSQDPELWLRRKTHFGK